MYSNIMNSIKLQKRMDAVFMNSKNSKTSDPHRLLLNLTDNIDLKRSDKCVAFLKSQRLLYMETYKKVTQK